MLKIQKMARIVSFNLSGKCVSRGAMEGNCQLFLSFGS